MVKILDKESYEHIFKQFQFVHRYLAKKVVDWYPISNSEIVIVFKDGSKDCYCCHGDTLRVAYNSEDYQTDEEEELAWKIEFAFRLKQTMLEQGYTQKLLSEATGISQAIISKYLNYKSVPSIYCLTKITRVLNCQVSDLIEF